MPFSLPSPHAPHDALPTSQPFGGPSQVTRFTVVEAPPFKSRCNSCGCATFWSAVAGRLHPRQISNMAVEVVGLQTLESGPQHRAALPIPFNVPLRCASPAGCRFFLQPVVGIFWVRRPACVCVLFCGGRVDELRFKRLGAASAIIFPRGRRATCVIYGIYGAPRGSSSEGLVRHFFGAKRLFGDHEKIGINIGWLALTVARAQTHPSLRGRSAPVHILLRSFDVLIVGPDTRVQVVLFILVFLWVVACVCVWRSV